MNTKKILSRIRDEITSAFTEANKRGEARDFDNRVFTVIRNCENTQEAVSKYQELSSRLEGMKSVNLIPEKHQMPFAEEELSDGSWGDVKRKIARKGNVRLFTEAMSAPRLR